MLSWFSARERRRRAAAKWFVRMRGSDSASLRERFERWRSIPQNAAAYESVERSYDAAALLRLSRPQPAPIASSEPSSTPRYGRVALAASIALALALPSAGLLLGVGPFAPALPLLLVSTAPGEVRTIELEDGSKIFIDSNSVVEYEPGTGPGRVVVRRGRARFVAASIERPFMVEAGGTRVEAGAAMFDVNLIGEGVSVSSLRGKVAVASGRAEARLEPGASARATGEAILPATLVDPAWPSGMLAFDDEPLATAIGRANRYSRKQIRLAGPGTASLRVTGAVRAGDMEGLAKSLAAAFDLELVHLPGGDIELRSKQR